MSLDTGKAMSIQEEFGGIILSCKDVGGRRRHAFYSKEDGDICVKGRACLSYSRMEQIYLSLSIKNCTCLSLDFNVRAFLNATFAFSFSSIS